MIDDDDDDDDDNNDDYDDDDDEVRRGDEGMALPSSREARRRRVCFGGDVTTTTIRNARITITLNEVLRYTNMFSLCSQGVWVAVGGPSPSGTVILPSRSTDSPALSFSQ